MMRFMDRYERILGGALAAITGGMAGVYYGYDEIPDRWKEKILVKEQLTSISKRMIEKYKLKRQFPVGFE